MFKKIVLPLQCHIQVLSSEYQYRIYEYLQYVHVGGTHLDLANARPAGHKYLPSHGAERAITGAVLINARSSIPTPGAAAYNLYVWIHVYGMLPAVRLDLLMRGEGEVILRARSLSP